MKYKSVQDRLIANSFNDSETGCWIWLGRFNNRFYPRINIWSKQRHRCVTVYAHRLSYEIFKEEKIPVGMELDHKCFNTSCINPNHLQIVTGTKNLQLRFSRQRGSHDRQNKIVA